MPSIGLRTGSARGSVPRAATGRARVMGHALRRQDLENWRSALCRRQGGSAESPARTGGWRSGQGECSRPSVQHGARAERFPGCVRAQGAPMEDPEWLPAAEGRRPGEARRGEARPGRGTAGRIPTWTPEGKAAGGDAGVTGPGGRGQPPAEGGLGTLGQIQESGTAGRGRIAAR